MLNLKLTNTFMGSRWSLPAAMLFVALSVASTRTFAQSLPSSSTPTAAVANTEQAQRNRITAERAAQRSSYELQRKACYQKFAVTPCLLEARDAHNEVLRDLKRQETALNDSQRKRKAAASVKSVEERNSPQITQQKADQRSRAIAQAQQREIAQQQEQRKREEKAAKPSAPPRRAASSGPVLPQGKPRAEPVPKLPPAQRAGQAEKIAKSQQEAAARDKRYAERRAKLAKQAAEVKKPPSAVLTIPKS